MCGITRIYYDSLNGQLKLNVPRWEGFANISNILSELNKFSKSLSDNNNLNSYGNKNQLITALKGLNDFSIKYKFDYVTNLTLEWLNKLNEKKYNKCEFKYIGYYNQIRDIMDKMLKEIKKKVSNKVNLLMLKAYSLSL